VEPGRYINWGTSFHAKKQENGHTSPRGDFDFGEIKRKSTATWFLIGRNAWEKKAEEATYSKK